EVFAGEKTGHRWVQEPVVNPNEYDGSPTVGAYGVAPSVPQGWEETQAAKPLARVMRMKTGESYFIMKQIYRMGRKSDEVDLVIPGNTLVGRVHAAIVYRDGAFYLVDNSSMNGTFVNGTRLQGGGKAPLQSGDRFSLADEEFGFEIAK
ncbi:MAG: FHA domain-containing protein, partial [Blautia sp.]|nr:FHA domain-containing protein [Blautia sp.]